MPTTPSRVCMEQNNQKLISHTENPFCSQRCYLLHSQMVSRPQHSSSHAVRPTQCKQLLNTLSGQPAASSTHVFALSLSSTQEGQLKCVFQSLPAPSLPQGTGPAVRTGPSRVLPTYRGLERLRFRTARNVSTMYHLNASNSINTNYGSFGISKHRQKSAFPRSKGPRKLQG